MASRTSAGRVVAIILGSLALAAGWIWGLLRNDDWSAPVAAVGTFAFVLAIGWPAIATFVRGFGEARRIRDAVAGGRLGEAVIERVHVSSLRVNGARLCELELLVHEPGREPYRTRTRTFVDEFFAAEVRPGAVVRVGRPDADRDTVVLIDAA